MLEIDKKIIIPTSHLDLDLFLGKLFVDLGWKVFFLRDKIIHHRLSDKDFDILEKQRGCMNISYNEFLNLEAEKIVITSSCLEHENDVFKHLVAQKKNAYVVHIMGNNITEPKWDDPFKRKWGRVIKNDVKNLIALDIQSFDYYQAKQVPNICHLQPNVMSSYSYEKLPDGRPVISCFIRQYSTNNYYKKEFLLYKKLAQRLSDICDIKLYGEDSPDGFLTANERIVEESHHTNELVLNEAIKKSWLVFHIRQFEGYGFNIVKSIISGRPIVSFKELVMNKTMQYLCIDGVSAILETLDRKQELVERIRYYLRNKDLLEELCQTTHRHAVHILDYEEQKRKTQFFLKNLKK